MYGEPAGPQIKIHRDVPRAIAWKLFAKRCRVTNDRCAHFIEEPAPLASDEIILSRCQLCLFGTRGVAPPLVVRNATNPGSDSDACTHVR